jgi:hypothetical protein
VTGAASLHLISPRARRIIAAVAFAIAFGVRAAWALRVQSPYGTIFSDMAGYVQRADWLLAGFKPGEPLVLLLWPWGTHVFLAAEFWIFGREAHTAIPLVQAFVGAIPAASAPLLAARLVPGRVSVAATGLAVALWQPQMVYVGFFSSEIWFAASIAVFAHLFARFVEGRGNGFVAGIPLAVAFAVRPQALVTTALLGLLVAIAMGRGLRRAFVARCALLLLPLALTVAGSALRYRHYTGRLNPGVALEPMQRVFGQTDVAEVKSSWTGPDGGIYGLAFAMNSKLPVAPENSVTFVGFIGDPEICARIERERLQGVPFVARVERWYRNVRTLVDLRPWPENQFEQSALRVRLQRVFYTLTWCSIPAALLGLFFMGRNRLARAVILANLITAPLIAAIYYGEPRHRTPYDTFLVVGAVTGVDALIRVAWAQRRRVRSRVLRARPARAS